MARHIAQRGYGIGLLLCSSAARAVQTAELLLRQTEVNIEHRDNLYQAGVPRLIAAIRGAPPAVSSLMVVGHSPGLEGCIAKLMKGPAPDHGLPTCGLVVLDFNVGRWRDVREGTGSLTGFVRPADI